MSEGASLVTMMQALGLLRSMGNSLGMAMLIFAVFLGRGAPLPPYNPMQGKPPV